MTGDADSLRAELRVRDPTPTGGRDRQTAVYDRLVGLREAGHVGDLDVEVWGKQVRTDGDAESMVDDALTGTALAAYERFEEWASHNDYDLEPAFDTLTVGSMVAEDCCEVVRFPVLTLAVYRGDDVVAVAPCACEQGVMTVQDCLEALEAGEFDPTTVEVAAATGD